MVRFIFHFYIPPSSLATAFALEPHHIQPPPQTLRQFGCLKCIRAFRETQSCIYISSSAQ